MATAADYTSAQTAMRILAKLGGSNRKMLVEPQVGIRERERKRERGERVSE